MEPVYVKNSTFRSIIVREDSYPVTSVETPAELILLSEVGELLAVGAV